MRKREQIGLETVSELEKRWRKAVEAIHGKMFADYSTFDYKSGWFRVGIAWVNTAGVLVSPMPGLCRSLRVDGMEREIRELEAQAKAKEGAA